MNIKLFKIIAIPIFLIFFIGNLTLTKDQRSLIKSNIVKISYSTNSNAELLDEICVNADRYGTGSSLTWFMEGDDVCYLCDKTGGCDDSCSQYEEVCWNLCQLVEDCFL